MQARPRKWSSALRCVEPTLTLPGQERHRSLCSPHRTAPNSTLASSRPTMECVPLGGRLFPPEFSNEFPCSCEDTTSRASVFASNRGGVQHTLAVVSRLRRAGPSGHPHVQRWGCWRVCVCVRARACVCVCVCACVCLCAHLRSPDMMWCRKKVGHRCGYPTDLLTAASSKGAHKNYDRWSDSLFEAGE
jgi:hypothetical protein